MITIVITSEGVEYRYKGGKRVYVSLEEWETVCRESLHTLARIKGQK